ncbi:MAG: radical SAM protein [Fibrobacteres bacterium]|nr:radical SAM protein [Fibrobacterota bacterium]
MSERRKAPSFLPATGVLELTYKCNHSCLFCSCPWENSRGDFAKENELTLDEWKAVITRFCSMGITNIALSGGEPLCRPDLEEIIAHAASCTAEHIEAREGLLQSEFGPPKIYLLSNGRNVTEKTLNMCIRYGVQLSMSLPGLETFEKHTGFDGADNVLKMFSLAKAKGMKTVANITVSKLNLSEFENTLSAALLAGAQQVLLNRFLPGGRGLSYEKELSLSVNELTGMLDTAERILETAGRFGSLGTEVPLCCVDPLKYKRLSVGTKCSAAIQFFVVGPSGLIRVCNHSPVNLCHVNDLDTLKMHPYWVKFTQKQYLPKECGGCRRISECDGGCREAAHITGGSPDSPDMLFEAGKILC